VAWRGKAPSIAALQSVEHFIAGNEFALLTFFDGAGQSDIFKGFFRYFHVQDLSAPQGVVQSRILVLALVWLSNRYRHGFEMALRASKRLKARGEFCARRVRTPC
jgi:hypothetical protein